LTAFADRHQVQDVVVVADAGMLSAAHLLALEDAGFPDDLAEHFKRHGNYFSDGQTIEATRTMGTGKDSRERRVVYQYSFKRSQHDNRAINKMIERADAVAAGTRPLKKDRFVKITDATKAVDWKLVERARSERLRHQHRRRPDGHPPRRRGLRRPLPNRTIVPDDQIRPRSTADLPLNPRQYRGPPDHRVHRSRGLPRSADPHRRQHQKAHPDPTAAAVSNHQPGPPARSSGRPALLTRPKASSTTRAGVSTKPIQLGPDDG
jgi:hypothetical protein